MKTSVLVSGIATAPLLLCAWAAAAAEGTAAEAKAMLERASAELSQ